MYNIAKLLVSPSPKNHFDQTPLHIIVRLGDSYLTHSLIQKGANVNAVDAFENTPLSLACVDTPNITIVKLLLMNGAHINQHRKIQINFFLESILYCKSETQLEIIKILIKEGVNINMTDQISNRNCMHYVAITGYVPLAELLLENGAILNIRDNFNCTPNSLAKSHQNDEILQFFMKYINDE